MTDVKRVFMVDGKPFYPLGVKPGDMMIGYNNESEFETAFEAFKLLHANTLLIRVYWDQVEPEEGKFDFTSVDTVLASAHRHGLKLHLHWLATWRNGDMECAPAWVKTNPQRFKRVISPTGTDIWVLSSHCQANLEADKKAFTAFCNHLKAKDSTERTVMALQVENEPGILGGSDRDYGPEAQVAFNSPVPAELVTAMKAAGRGRVYDIWQQTGGKGSGTWPELFGWAAGELMTAWSIATYIDGVAEAGKASYDIPMYINAWLMEQPWPIPGEIYPSGGPVTKVLDIYKWFTPHVDLIAPDIYIPDSKGYESACATYSRDDNPLFVPESHERGSNAWNMFRAIADYNAIGYFLFGNSERIVAEDGSVRPESQMMVDSFRCVAAVIPLLLKYQGTGKIHGVIQEELMDAQLLDLDGYLGLVKFGGWQWHLIDDDEGWWQTDSNRGRGLVIQASRNEFYLVGANYRLFLCPKLSPAEMRASWYAAHSGIRALTPYLSVEEGHFDQGGEFVVDRRRSGDLASWGAWVEANVGVVRVIMCD